MLDAFIIEEIQRRERDAERIRPQLERPLPTAPPQPRHADDDDVPGHGRVTIGEGAPERRSRGPIVIDRDASDDDDEGMVVIDM